MPAIGVDDPEMSYRRGFEHGAVEMFRAVEQFLDPATREVLRAWIQDIHGWRYKAMLGYPPTWRLASLNNPRHCFATTTRHVDFVSTLSKLSHFA
jgi:hypothetical protein